MHVAYFGFDSSDATIRKRVRTLQANGYEVDGFMNKRLDGPDPEWNNIELCKTENAAYLNRIASVFKGAFRAAKHKDTLAKADAILARNLDMLATAFLTKRLTGLKTPVVYECLDVHRLLCRQDPLGWVARKIEGALLKRSRGVLVSSPAFVEHHFERYYAGTYRAFLIENRLPAAFANQVQRPGQDVTSPESDRRPLRLGWVGILRCQRTLDLLVSIAQDLGDAVEIHMYGKPALASVPNFHEAIGPVSNLTFHGAYRAPDDLPEIYGDLDLIWSGDFMEAGLNSTWLLPNRIYEGGYFAVPAITPDGTQTAAWVSEKESGFLVSEPLEANLPKLLRTLMTDRDAINSRRQNLLALPDTALIEPAQFLGELMDRVLQAEDSMSAPLALGQPDPV